MIKQAWKKITAVTCAVAMLVTGIGVIPKVQAEEAPSNLTSLGWSDFGFTDDTVIKSGNDDAANWGIVNKNLTTGKSIVNSSFRGTIKFNKTSASQYLQYGAWNVVDGKGIRIRLETDGTLNVINMWTGASVGVVNPETAGLAEKTFNGVAFELGLDFWKADTEYKLNVYINGNQYGNTYVLEQVDKDGTAQFNEGLSLLNQGDATLSDTIEIQIEREKAPSGLASVTWADFGFTDDTVLKTGYDDSTGWGITNKNLVAGKSIINSSFRGTIKFNKTTAAQYLQYGAWNAANGKGIRIRLDADGTLNVINMWTGASVGVINPETAGLTEKTFNGVAFELGLDFWKKDGAYKLNVYINGEQYNKAAYVITNVEVNGTAQFDAGLSFVNSGAATLQDTIEIQVPSETAPTGLTSLKWADFGIGTVTDIGYNESSWGLTDKSLTAGTLVGTSFSGEIEISKTSGKSMWIQYGANTAVYGEKGIRFTVKDDGTIVVNHMLDGKELVTITPTKAGLTDGKTFLNTKFKLQIDLWNPTNTNDLKMIVSINGKQYDKQGIVLENGKGTLIDGINFLVQGENDYIRVTGEKEVSPEGLTQIGWKDFGITDDKTVTNTSGNDSTISVGGGHSFINTSFRGEIKFNRTSDGSLMLHFGQGGWYGLRMSVKEKAVTINGTIGSASLNETTITSETGVANRELELGLDIWKVNDNDVKINVFIDGEQVTDVALIWKGVADQLNGTISAVVGEGNSIDIILNEEAPAGLPKVNWKSLNIAEGEYGYKKNNEGSYIFSADGHTKDASFKNSSFRGLITFTDENIALHYGDNWYNYENGLKFTLQTDGSILVVNNHFGTLTTLKPNRIGKNSFKGQEFELGIDSWTEGNDIKFNIYINGIQYNYKAYLWENGKNTDLAFDDLTVGIIAKADTPKIAVKYPAQEFVDIQATPAGYLPSGAQVRINDNPHTVGNALTSVGDYHVVVVDANGVTATDVACYKPGDAHVDGEFDIRDVVAVKKAAAGQTTSSLARQKAADVNPDGNYDVNDMKAVYDLILGVATSTPNMAYSYSFRNDSNVMPIGGFVGPYDLTNISTDYTKVNLITDDVYKKIADCGITFITGSTHGQGWDSSELILKQLKLTEKYGIDMFVKDTTWYEGASQEVSAKTLAERMAKYSNFKSFKGLFIMDEPTLVGTYGNSQVQSGSHGDLQWNRTTQLSTLLNSYSNLTAYINMLPLRNSMNIGSKTDVEAYKAYLETYCENYSPKFLSYDYYPWEWQTNVITGKGFSGDNAVNAGSYFKNLAIVRDMANKYQIPFWTHVESGDGFAEKSGKDQGGNPTEGKFKWQINVELAFGAKGIQYFPLVQPNGYEVQADGTVNYRRNGLIGKDGQTNVWYNYAKEMNTQIQNMDHVLMNSVSKGLLVTGGYATSNMEYAKNEGMPILTQFVLSGNPTITGISTNETGSSTYGAIAGCFDYCGKSAVYVVNYNVTSAQNITVNWNQSHTYTKIDKNGDTPCGAATSCTLSLGAGEAALLVLE